MPPSESGEPIAPAANDGQRPGRRLTILYTAALSTVAVLSIGAQGLIQRQLHNGESDSRVINVAGRQRMLSQRLAKAALRIESAGGRADEAARSELRETLRLWSVNHAALQQGDAQQRVPGKNSGAVAELFAAIEPEFRAMNEAARRLATPPWDEARGPAAVATIQDNEGRFLDGMDAIVNQYVVEAERRVARLRRLESAILALTLGVLLAEGLLIFRPAVRRIEQTVARLSAVSRGLRTAKEEAEQASAAKTRFLANVSHELRTPMTAVLGMTELAQNTPDDRERSRFLSIVAEAGNSLLNLLNDLIDLARIDAGKMVLASEPFAPQAVLDRVVRLMQTAADAKRLGVAAEAPAPGLWVLGDERRLEQVLLNLVDNGIKATVEGGVFISCTVVARSDRDATLCFNVRDTGVGMSPNDQQRIFEPFTQLPGQGRGDAKGAGLGLAICRRIADAMGAKITVLSTPEVGATITLTTRFPLAAEPTPAPANEPRLDTPGLRVLVAEDTRVNQILLREILERAGHTATITGSGEAAIDAFATAKAPYDAALIDFQLPGIDGVATAEAIRQQAGRGDTAAPRLIGTTAHAGFDAAGDDRLACFDAVVTKPLRSSDLLGALAAAGPSIDSQSDESAGSPSEPGLLEELADAFLAAAPRQREELAAAIEGGRRGEARLLAHRFRGQVQYFDTGDLGDRLSDLESACERGDREAVEAQAPGVLASLDRLIDQFDSIRGGVRSPIASAPLRSGSGGRTRR